jgi:hypothetical protein
LYNKPPESFEAPAVFFVVGLRARFWVAVTMGEKGIEDLRLKI